MRNSSKHEQPNKLITHVSLFYSQLLDFINGNQKEH